MKFRRILLLFIILVFFLLIVSALDIYVFKQNLFVGAFCSKIIPFPAIYSNGSFISFYNYEKFVEDYKIYFLFNKNIEEDKYINSAIKQMLGINFIEKMQKKFNVNCDKDTEYINFKKGFYAQNSIDENTIKKLSYNLNFKQEKFEEYVVFPAFCRMKISEKLLTIDENRNQRKKIDEVYSDVVKNIDRFTEYSERYNDKNIAPIKKIGWLSKDDLPSGLADLIDNMKVGDISPVLQSTSGYHVYKIESILVDDQKNQNFYEISQIFFPTKNLNDYINEYLTNGKFKVLVP
ncbi:MAG TPA: peptidylprolyl isomerase [bacterium]|nr:peptidylprolyl isomerase [bacterium]HOG38204.1 peptidylprolyl isomerase [bacterium]HQI03206.1 peptidylprolyl isomerase [bacterium]